LSEIYILRIDAYFSRLAKNHTKTNESHNTRIHCDLMPDRILCQSYTGKSSCRVAERRSKCRNERRHRCIGQYTVTVNVIPLPTALNIVTNKSIQRTSIVAWDSRRIQTVSRHSAIDWRSAYGVSESRPQLAPTKDGPPSATHCFGYNPHPLNGRLATSPLNSYVCWSTGLLYLSVSTRCVCVWSTRVVDIAHSMP